MNRIHKVNNWIQGIVFLGIAAVFLLGKTYIFGYFSLAKVLITLFLISSIVKSIPYRNFFGMLVPAAILYIMYARHIWWFLPFNGWSLIWAAVFASVGLSFLFKRRPYGYFHENRYYTETAEKEEEEEEMYYE